jgi:acetylornithine deacetylase/succinyl-diaminopimelate desuccinylase-like protein
MLHARLAELAGIGATPNGIDRALFTPAERAARERFVAWARAERLRVEQDRAGNVFARLDASTSSAQAGDAAPVQCGSHLDTASALRGPSGLLDGVPVRDGFPPPAAYVELHIEQGPVMEREGARLGIVSVIAGQRRFRVAVDGVAGHAGTVPMRGRSDALCAASELVLAVERAALDTSDTVATVGHLVVEPNQTNIVPGRVALRIDLRSVDDGRIEACERRIRAHAAEIAAQRGVRVSVDTLESRAAVPMETRMRLLARAACLERDPRALTIASGAGHDAMCIAHVAPAAMIFVPSIGGRSHVGDERTAPSDLELGVEALAATLLAAARAPWPT